MDKFGFIVEDTDGRMGTSGGSRTTKAHITDKERRRRADLESSRTSEEEQGAKAGSVGNERSELPNMYITPYTIS